MKDNPNPHSFRVANFITAETRLALIGDRISARKSEYPGYYNAFGEVATHILSYEQSLIRHARADEPTKLFEKIREIGFSKV